MHGIQSCLIMVTLTLFKNTHCSVKRQMEPFVVNGEFANIRNYPYCVYIFADCNGKWICGSSVLNQKILLTAAHCLFGCEVKGRIDAFAGHENIRQVKVKRKAQKIIIHERYNDKTIINDIGLILLQGNLPLGDSIKRVIITKQDNTGLQGVVAGWGVVNDGTKQGTALLKWAKQTVRSKQTCLKLGNLLPGVMCAGSVYSKYARPSQGDSGSALIAPKYRQIGIVSFRYSTYPGLVIYTNISYHLEWIKKNLERYTVGRKCDIMLHA